MGKPNPQNLTPCNSENARERQLKSAEKRKENHAKKVLMSQIYAEFLEKKHDIKTESGIKKISGEKILAQVVGKILSRGDASSVAMMKEIREATEGSKVQMTGNISTKLETQEERLKLFNEIVN
jgi:hypothetical protein